jgi:hypothetical protein
VTRPDTGDRTDRRPLQLPGLAGGFCACLATPETDAVVS